MTDLELINLQDNLKLSTIHFTDHEDWLEKRKAGIGGSDIGALMGLNKYSSPMKIYKQKCEGWSEDMSDNVFVKKGTDLEDLILDKYVRPMVAVSGYQVLKPDFMIINSDYEYLRANIDGMAFRPGEPWQNNFGVEIKWVSEWAEENWRGSDYGGIPASYYAQVQLYMAVTGLRSWHLFALFDSTWTVEEFIIPRDEMFILKLTYIAKKFYEYNMQTHIPPALTTSLDKEDVVEVIKKIPEPTIADSRMSHLVSEYLNLGKQIKELEEQQNALKDDILKGYRSGFFPDDTSHSVKLSIITSHRFNSTKFKKDHPEEYEQYCEDSESSKFTIK